MKHYTVRTRKALMIATEMVINRAKVDKMINKIERPVLTMGARKELLNDFRKN